jgi:hypothetical protein
MAALGGMHARLKPYYSEIGRPSIDPELMIRMLIVGYCYGLRSERRLTQEVDLHLAYRWFCRLDLDDKVPHHSTFQASSRRHGLWHGQVSRLADWCRNLAAYSRLGQEYPGGRCPLTLGFPMA